MINPLIYAEVSVRFTTIAELDASLAHDGFLRSPLPSAAGFLPGSWRGKACHASPRDGGGRQAPLPESIIGAHAGEPGLRLPTYDHGRYATSFPSVGLLAPKPKVHSSIAPSG